MNESIVAAYQGEGSYAAQPPFNPDRSYKEYPFKTATGPDLNPGYSVVREIFRLLELDVEHFGEASWNPLGFLISPGDKVVIKPNLIRESHIIRKAEWQQIVTHGSIIRAVIDYALIALRGEGSIVVADGPQTDSDFQTICERTGITGIVEFYKRQGIDIQLLDLRRDRWFDKGEVIYERIKLPGDPNGYTSVDLGESSEFFTYKLNGRFYGADYDMKETARFHANGRHEYILCRTIMDADVVINLPKMKTHKKTGVTLSLKNMVGINGYRNCLPHHSAGTPEDGGDEFRQSRPSHRVQSRAIVAFKKLLTVSGGTGGSWARLAKKLGRRIFGDTNEVVRSGNWYGNDTAWRMVLDLNKALFYFDGAGKPRSRPLRYLTIIDGIIAGDGDGPVVADPKETGVVVAGLNPIAVDTVAATLMGFDYRRIPVLQRGWRAKERPLASFDPAALVCRSNISEWSGSLAQIEQARHLGFRPHFGWRGHIERDGAPLVPSFDDLP